MRTARLDIAAVEEPRESRAAARVQLRETRDAGRDEPARGVRGAIPAKPRDVGLQERPRPNDTHLAAEHVDELWELIEPCRPQRVPHSRDPTIRHGPELVDPERPTAAANAALHEQRRAAVLEPDERRDREPHGAQHEDRNRGGDEVE